MLLFKPREFLPCNEAMRYKYFQYSNLLRRYMEQKYGSKEIASYKFTRIMILANQLHVIRNNYRILLQELSPSHVVQVLAEVFNLNDDSN